MEIQMTSTTTSYDVVLLPKAKPEDMIKITTTVTNDPNAAMTWIEDVGKSATLGLEVLCSRHDDDDSKKKPAILTLCDVGRVLILQLCYVSDKEMIKDMVFPVERFVGTNMEHSAVMLQEEYGINLAGYEVEDIGDITREAWFEELFIDSKSDRIVAKLMMDLILMKKKMPEVELGVAWEKEKLDRDVVAYATLESYVYYMIGEGHKYYA